MKLGILLFSINCVFWSCSGYANSRFDQQGVEAYKRYDYPAAVYFFKQSLQKKPDNYLALHNIAMSYFKLGDYAQANAYLLTLAFVEELDTSVLYTLAVTEKKLGNTDQAIELFEDITRTDNPRFAQAAQKQIDLLKARKRKPRQHDVRGIANQPQKKWMSNVNFSLAYDDSVIDQRDDSIKQGDAYNEINFSSHWKGESKDGKSWFFDGLLYNSRYWQVDDIDYTLVSLGFGRIIKSEKHRLRMSMSVEHASLDGDDYLQFLVLTSTYSRPFKNNLVWGVKFRGKLIRELNREYEHLSGNLQSFENSLTWKLSKRARLRIRHQFTLDRRGSRSMDDEFNERMSYTDFSADRNTVKISWDYRFPKDYSLSILSAYRSSNYIEPYIYQYQEGERRDKKLSLGFDVSKAINDSWTINAGYHYSNNSSSLARYDYDQSSLYLSADWHF